MEIIKYLMLPVAVVTFSATAQVLEPDFADRESCTSIMVGKKASTDGSVMTSHTCDGNYRAWMDIVPGKSLGHDTTAVVVTGRMHTDHSTGARGMKEVGTIPVSGNSYSFLNTAYPCLNERQLGIGETTISGRKELRNPKGMFMIEELERIVLQHCTTAREAIKMMGKLVKEYGYGDSGECLTIADPNEVWQFEIFGEGPDKIGGVWAAVRIPDDEVGVSANIPRISTINIADTANYLASENVFSVAKKMKLWDGKEPFKFWKAYSGGNYFGEPKAFSIREYFILNKIAPSLGLKYDSEELPLSVKPDNKLSAADVMNLLAETYEGTEWDMTKNLKIERKNNKTGETDTIVSPVANPWMNRDYINLFNALCDSSVINVRNVSVPQCSYSTVIQLRDWLPDGVGGVAWVAFDNPGQSPRIPIFCGAKDLPESFKIDGQLRYDDNSALWAFRKANKLATIKWGETRKDIEKGRQHYIDKGVLELPLIEKIYKEISEKEGIDAANEYLTDYTADFAGAAINRWNSLSDKYWSKYGRSF
ncbi:MAG: C69 family dipeptidase [Paramuribaculum sp.]|nr:C69 family dipeptidase [Paramuribaculum sp.]